MKEFTIQKNDAGQRLDKYLKKLLPNAGSGFLYKMLRKKNITRNGKKAEGNELLCAGDCIRIFFSEDTFGKFAADTGSLRREYDFLAGLPMKGLAVVCEDADILALDKPAGMLSQKAEASDVSANEYMLGYLIREGAWDFSDMATFRPSVCNRLDRNTTGLLLAGKTLKGLQELSGALQSREAKKYYRAVVAGSIDTPAHLTGYLKKDTESNRVSVCERPQPGAQPIETVFTPLITTAEWTVLEIRLITGKSHQIRAHLAGIGHPVIGDPKYGDADVNRRYLREAGISRQLLHAYRVELLGREAICAPLPKEHMIFYKET